MNTDTKEQEDVRPFNIRQPFRTKCGWPARLMGLLRRSAYPYVVAVWNPAFNAEEMHCYASDGEQPTDGNYYHDLGAKNGALSLVNISDDEYFAVAPGTLVHASVEMLPAWPPNCNSMRHDSSSMGTPLVRGWIALHEGFGRPDNVDPLRSVQLVNEVSGQRFMVRFAPALTAGLVKNDAKDVATQVGLLVGGD